MTKPVHKTEPETPSKRKLRAFKAGAFLLSLIALVLLEIVLRLSGYGTDYPLFIEAKSQPDYLVMNPEISKKYFFDQENATVGYQETFKKIKEPNTHRIFVLGASTSVGYPYGHNGSFHRWLQYALNLTYPDKHIEIINLSLTAVNTYTLLDFTEQLVHYQPDTVLIYTGHNEYYGALGVGSVNSLGRSPWLVRLVLKLREYRLVQLISNFWKKIQRLWTPAEAGRETLMKKMVADQQIPFDSKLYHLGIEQFKTNLKSLLSELDEKSIPTYISTVVSNEKDLHPFISDSTYIEKSAAYHFKLAQKRFSESDYDSAKAHFINAKELDLLRFRAPQAINENLRDIAKEFENIHVVETYQEFVEHTEHGIIGNEQLLEHVHPNLTGYALISYSFYKHLLRDNTINAKQETVFSFDGLLKQMPVTIVDSIKASYEISSLKEGWPFYEPMPKFDKASLSIPEKLAGKLLIQEISWEQAMDNLYLYYRNGNEYEKAFRVLEGITLEYPNEPKFHIKAGELAAQLHKTMQANFLFQRAFRLAPSLDLAKKIAVTLVDNDIMADAIPYLDYIVKNEPGNSYGTRLSATVRSILKLTENGIPSVAIDYELIQLAENYRLLGKREKAIFYVQKILEKHPNHKKANTLMDNLN